MAKWRWTESIECASKFGNVYADPSTPHTEQLLRRLLFCLLPLLGSNACAEGVPDDCTQLIVAIAPTWDSMRGELRLFERPRGGDWKAVAGPFSVLFGKRASPGALAWLVRTSRD